MKKNLTKWMVAGAIALGMSSCATVMTPAGMGGIYTDITAGEHVTSNLFGVKVGTATASNILGLVVLGDASIETAAKSAGIRKVSHVDCKKTNILGLYSTYKVIVYGD